MLLKTTHAKVVEPRRFPDYRKEFGKWYGNIGADASHKHAVAVLDVAVRNRIAEEEPITHYIRRGIGRRRALANARLAALVLAHNLDTERITHHTHDLPRTLQEDPEILIHLHDFCMIRKLGYEPYDSKNWQRLITEMLTRSDKSLAVPATIADVASTHVKDRRLAQTIHYRIPKHPLLHTTVMGFARMSTDRIIEMLCRRAIANIRIFGPLAEKFGWSGAAGDIYDESCSVLYPLISRKVDKFLADSEEKIRFTEQKVRQLQFAFEAALNALEIDAEIGIRRKHPGKIKFKVRRRYEGFVKDIREGDYRGIVESSDMRNFLNEFDALKEIKDIIGMRIVIDRIEGKRIDEFDENEIFHLMKEKLVPFIDGMLRTCFNLDKQSHGFEIKVEKHVPSSERDKQYRGLHIKIIFGDDSEYVHFEIQLRTRKWHNESEKGLLAHHFYLGGDPQVVKKAERAVIGILKMNGNGSTAKR